MQIEPGVDLVQVAFLLVVGVAIHGETEAAPGIPRQAHAAVKASQHAGKLVSQERFHLRRHAEIAELDAGAHRRGPQPGLAVGQLQHRLGVDRRCIAQPAAGGDAAARQLDRHLPLGLTHPSHGRRMSYGDPRLLGGHPDRVIARPRLRQRAVEARRPGIERRRQRQRLRNESRIGPALHRSLLISPPDLHPVEDGKAGRMPGPDAPQRQHRLRVELPARDLGVPQIEFSPTAGSKPRRRRRLHADDRKRRVEPEAGAAERNVVERDVECLADVLGVPRPGGVDGDSHPDASAGAVGGAGLRHEVDLLERRRRQLGDAPHQRFVRLGPGQRRRLWRRSGSRPARHREEISDRRSSPAADGVVRPHDINRASARRQPLPRKRHLVPGPQPVGCALVEVDALGGDEPDPAGRRRLCRPRRHRGRDRRQQQRR